MHPGTWPSVEIARLERSLKALVKLVDEQARSGSDDVVRELSRFLVIRSCGLVEQIAEECCRSYLRSKSDPRSSSFGQSWLGRGANPSPGNLVKLVSRFDPRWADDLNHLFDADDELLKRELVFLVDRRNKIAHGLSEGIGARKALDLADIALAVSGWFISTVNPTA